MTKYMVVLLMAGLACGCDKTTSTEVKAGDKTTSTEVKAGDKSFVPVTSPATPVGEKSFNPSAKPSVRARAVVPKAKLPKVMAEEKAITELAASKANLEKVKAVWQAEPASVVKREAYDAAVADLMGKTGAASKK